jgi:DNA-binding CsgD family transcriptional regulator
LPHPRDHAGDHAAREKQVVETDTESHTCTAQLLGLLLAAYGLTTRERDLCREVISGRLTLKIARHLFISSNTVQDHLKSIFAKVGVHSRGELVARLRPNGTYTPAASQPFM